MLSPHHLRNSLCNQNRGHEGDYIFNDYNAPHFHNGPIPDFRIGNFVAGSHITLQFVERRDLNAPEILEDFKSRTSFERVFPPDSLGVYTIDLETLRKLPHELLCAVIAQERSDSSLSNLPGISKYDNLTPDFIFQYPKTVHVIEVKTTAGKIYSSMLNNARLLYEEAIVSKLHPLKRTFSYVVYGSPTAVVHNLPNMTQDTLNLMITMVKLGLEIQRAARSKGWVLDTDTTSQLSRIKENLVRLQFNAPDEEDPKKLMITPERMKEWSTWDTRTKEIYFINACIKDMQSKGSKLVHNSETAQETISKFVKKYDAIEVNRRRDPKAVVNLPFLAFQRRFEFPSADLILLDGSDSEVHTENCLNDDEYKATFELWEDALGGLVNGEVIFDEEYDVVKDIAERLERGEEIKAEDKRQTNRVKVVMEESNWEKLAEIGIQGRKYKDLISKEEKREYQKLGFELSVDISDIERAIKNPFYYHESPTEYQEINITERFQDMYELIERSVGKTKTSDACFGDYETFFKSRIGRFGIVLHELAMEVNVSTRQNCRTNQFILKKLHYLGAYVLIKPSNALGRCHFSILYETEQLKEEDPNYTTNLFKAPYVFGRYSCTSLISWSAHDITHYLNAHVKLANLYFMWCQLYHLKPGDGITNRGNNIAERATIKSMLNCNLISFFVYAEHKRQTSSHFQQIRYYYMEALRPAGSGANPMKVLNKFEMVIRTRMVIWLFHALCTNIFPLLSNPPRIITISHEPDEDEQVSGEQITFDSVANLPSIIDCAPIERFEIALNISYIGYLHNKDTGEEVQSYFQIFEKLTASELKLEEARNEYMGREDNNDVHDIREHEFNVTMMALAGDFVKKKLLDNTRAGAYDDWFLDNYANQLIDKDLMHYATTKASAHDIIDTNDVKKLNKRKKCLEMAMELVYDDTFSAEMSENYQGIMDDVTKDGLKANLFKKNQIGSTREIFVLEYKSKILMSLIETLARSVGIYLPSEMISKGDQKTIRNDEHIRRITEEKREGRTESYTTTNSSDAKTWCQRFVMPCFGVFLSRIVPASLFPLVASCLNAVTFKKLELPSELLKRFANNPEIQSFRPSLNVLKKSYLEGGVLMEKDSALMKCQSNMMQGILHEVSSITHAGVLMIAEHVNKVLFSKYLQYVSMDKRDAVLVTSYRCSSDDSALVSTIVHKKDPKINRSNLLAISQFICATPTYIYKQTCMENSEPKSTICLEGLCLEFNSYWTILNTVITPLIKFVFVAFDLPCQSRIESRQYHLHSMLSQNLENGASLGLLARIHVGQAMSYYNSLGAGLIDAFNAYLPLLRKYRHPSIGFFCLQPLELCGVLGFEYALYNHCRGSDTVRKLQHAQFLDDNSHLSADGKPLSRVVLNFALSKKYQSFVKRVDASEDYIEKVFEADPESIYNNRPDKRATKVKLMMKCLNPDISSSFSFDTTSKLYAASVYMLQTNCMSFKVKNTSTGETDLEKLSYYQVGKKLIRRAKKLGPWTDRDWSFHFPNSKEYDFMNNVIFKFRSCRLIRSIKPRRKVFSAMPVMRGTGIYTRSIMQLARWKWFEKETMSSNTVARELWASYKQIYPWLRDNYHDTLSDPECPFKTHQAMYNFIRSCGSATTTIRYLAPVRRSASVVDTLVKMLYQYQWPTYVVMPGSGDRQALPFCAPGDFENQFVELEPKWEEMQLEGAEDDNSEVQHVEEIAGDTSEPPLNRASYLKTYSDKIWRLGLIDHKLNRTVPIMQKLLGEVRKEISRPQISSFLSDESDKQLAVVAHALVSRTESEYCSLLEHSRHGIAFRYDIRQRYNKDTGIYEGPLKITGIADGMIFSLQGTDDTIHKMDVASKKLTRQKHRCRKICALVRRMNLLNTKGEGEEYLNTAGSCIVQSRINDMCVPIFENLSLKHTQFVPIHDKPVRPRLEVNNFRIRVTPGRNEFDRNEISYPSMCWILKPFSSDVVYSDSELNSMENIMCSERSVPYRFFIRHQLMNARMPIKNALNLWRREGTAAQLQDDEHECVKGCFYRRLARRGKIASGQLRKLMNETEELTEREMRNDDVKEFEDTPIYDGSFTEQMGHDHDDMMKRIGDVLYVLSSVISTPKLELENQVPNVATLGVSATLELQKALMQEDEHKHASLLVPEATVLNKYWDYQSQSQVFDELINKFEGTIPNFFMNFFRAEQNEEYQYKVHVKAAMEPTGIVSAFLRENDYIIEENLITHDWGGVNDGRHASYSPGTPNDDELEDNSPRRTDVVRSMLL